MTGRADGALAAAAALGPFFVLQTAHDEHGWVSWADLVERPDALEKPDPLEHPGPLEQRGPLDRRVREVQALLANGPGAPEVPLRVAASIVHLGLVARLLSPPLGAALTTGVLPELTAGTVRLRLTGSNPLPMAFHTPTARTVRSPAELAAALDGSWITPLIAPLDDAVAAHYRLSRRVLGGNSASAVAGTLHAATATRPDLGTAADAVLDALLSTGSLAGRGHRRDNGSLLRRSCCLLYQLPGAGLCGDCVLTARPSR